MARYTGPTTKMARKFGEIALQTCSTVRLIALVLRGPGLGAEPTLCIAGACRGLYAHAATRRVVARIPERLRRD